MMTKDDRETLRDVCFSVFEQLAFMFGDELEEDELDIEINNGRLTVKGSQKQNNDGKKFLHHGIRSLCNSLLRVVCLFHTP